MEVDYHFIREKLTRNMLLVYVNIENQVADFLTKAVERVKLHNFLSKLGM